LPPVYRANINIEVPFRTTTAEPALTNAEISDVINFLKTLTDGFAAE
jgi:cytochrome c peroxidase